MQVPVSATPPVEQPPAQTASAAAPRRRLLDWLHGAETWALTLILAVMTALPVLEAVLRRFGTTVPGSADITQKMTLWVGFLGALLAAGTGRHLSLATGEAVPQKLRAAARFYAGLVAAVTSAVLAYASVRLVQADSSMPGGVAVWWAETIMPVATGLMALRFARHASDRVWLQALAMVVTVLVFAAGFTPEGAGWVPAFVKELDPASLRLPGTIALLAALLVGAPIFVGMAGIAMLLFFADYTPIASVPAETYRLVASATLPAIPLLTVAGYILAEGGASKRLLRLARALVGWMPGGLALVACGVLAAFTSFTGGSGVTILALGGLILPMLVQEKYPEGFSLGMVMSSGSLGLLFPPSLPVILYAVVAGANHEDLYIAGFLPGLLIVLVVAAYGVAMGVKQKAPRQPFQIREVASSLWESKWELLVPVVVVGAIVTGWATLVEAAAIAVAAAFFSQVVVWKDLHPFRQMPKVLANAAMLVGAVLILLGVAMGLTSYLVDAEIPSAVLEWTRAHIHSKIAFLLVLNVVLLVLGSVLEIFSAIVVLAPLLAPMAAAYGIDPMHLGIVFLANLELGFLLPPMGLNLLLASSRFGQPLAKLYRHALPFLLIRAVALLLVTYIPAMTTGVLHTIRPQTAPAATAPAAAAPEAPPDDVP